MYLNIKSPINTILTVFIGLYIIGKVIYFFYKSFFLFLNKPANAAPMLLNKIAPGAGIATMLPVDT